MRSRGHSFEIWLKGLTHFNKKNLPVKGWFLADQVESQKEVDKILKERLGPAKVVRNSWQRNLVYYRKGNGLGQNQKRKVKLNDC